MWGQPTLVSQQPAALVPERVLDVPDRKAAGEELDRQPLQRFGAPLQVCRRISERNGSSRPATCGAA